MEIPAGGILEGAALQQDVLAFPEGDHHRTEERLDLLLVQGRIRIIQRTGGQACLVIPLVRIPDIFLLAQHAAFGQDLLPQVRRDLALLDLAPGIAVAVDDALAGNGDVMLPCRMDRREAATDIQTLEIRVDDRIQVLVGIEDDHRSPLQVQVDVALQSDRSGLPDPGRNDEMTAALFRQPVDGPGKRRRIVGDTVTDGSEIRQGNGAGRNGRQTPGRHVERKVSERVGDGRTDAAGNEQSGCDKGYQDESSHDGGAPTHGGRRTNI